MKRGLNIRRTIAVTCIADIVLMVCLLLAALYIINAGDAGLSQIRALLIVLAAISLLCAIISLLFAVSLIDRDVELSQTKASVGQMNELNNTLRAQRHDYLNHLQVVYGLMELEQYDDANNYIEQVYSDIQKVNSVLKTAIPAVNAILQAKQQMCQSRGIEMTVDARTSLEGIPVEDWELCRIFGNVIDNAINAMADMEGAKRLTIELGEDIRGFSFAISNNGPVIPKVYLPRIFDAGFTHGSHKGDGMGLAICRRILAKYGGEMTVRSDEDITVFCAFVPKSTPETTV